MRREDKEYLDLFATGIRAELKSNHDITDIIYKEIVKQNGRIGKLEDQTVVARWVQKHPRAILMSMVGVVIVFVLIAEILGIGEIIRIFLFKA